MDQFKGDGSSEDIQNFDQNFNDIFIQISKSIEDMVNKNKADEAFEVLNSFVITANLYAQINNNILNKLSNITGKLKMLLGSIAKKLQAASYSISGKRSLNLRVFIKLCQHKITSALDLSVRQNKSGAVMLSAPNYA